MALSRLSSSSVIADVGDLVLLASIPFLVAISLLGVFGFTAIAAVFSIVFFVGVVPLLVLFGDSLLTDATDDENDPVADLRDQYVDGELSEAELERAVGRELSSDDGDADTDGDTTDSDDGDQGVVSSSETERTPEYERR
ncbi:hypothetical protein [Natrialba sp. SSL1]|uniref:hypothetical protein n=1 Tax=Natrialba sp. SSL1 TaxID=1869245 RepID=UPI0008F8DF7D|nr:hypothetical protein [Natrialba sp. SSL1]OIB59099.1 hypothetical protein BBD46_06070 [Natrialba sp. SSL1]